MIYKTDSAAEGQGSLAAPFDGIHGWYFNNESDNDIVLDIEIVGFYELYEEEHWEVGRRDATSSRMSNYWTYWELSRLTNNTEGLNFWLVKEVTATF